MSSFTLVRFGLPVCLFPLYIIFFLVVFSCFFLWFSLVLSRVFFFFLVFQFSSCQVLCWCGLAFSVHSYFCFLLYCLTGFIYLYFQAGFYFFFIVRLPLFFFLFFFFPVFFCFVRLLLGHSSVSFLYLSNIKRCIINVRILFGGNIHEYIVCPYNKLCIYPLLSPSQMGKRDRLGQSSPPLRYVTKKK